MLRTKGGAANAPRITFLVISRSDYADRRRAPVREMEEIAWILRSDPKKNTVGFVKASEIRRLSIRWLSWAAHVHYVSATDGRPRASQ